VVDRRRGRLARVLARSGGMSERVTQCRRPTFADVPVPRLLLASGTDIVVVRDILGHSTIALTADTYAAVLPSSSGRPLGGWRP